VILRSSKFALKTTSLLVGPCSSVDVNLLSCKECCVYRTLIAGYLWHPERQLYIGILNTHAQLRLASLVGRLAHKKNWHPVRQSLHTEDSYWWLLWEAFTIDPMSADQYNPKNWYPARSNIIQYESRFD
jgi:hypothetical protein